MKRFLITGAIGVLAIVVFAQLAHVQGDSEVLSKKQAQAEVAADSDQYVIGVVDVLYIHVWREETLSKTVRGSFVYTGIVILDKSFPMLSLNMLHMFILSFGSL